MQGKLDAPGYHAILTSVLNALAANGIRKISTDDTARGAVTWHSTVYLHYRNK